MRHIQKVIGCILSAVILLSMFALSASAAEAYVPVNDIVREAERIIYANEGNYASVVKNDNGALSIGKVQWHGDRALALLRDIILLNDTNARNILGDTLYQEIQTTPSWGIRILNDDEASRISTLINTSEGRSVQDTYSHYDIKSYILHGKYLGIKDPQALIYYADIENQYGYGGVTRIIQPALDSVGGDHSKLTLDIIHWAVIEDNNYPSRRTRTYEGAKKVNFTYTTVVPAHEIWRLNGGVNMRTGPNTDYAVLTTVPGGTEVRVFSKVDRGIYTWGETENGWLVLRRNSDGNNFCSFVESVPASGGVHGNGDANGDQTLSLADVLLTARYALDNTIQIQVENADMNGDGSISLADVLAIARLVVSQ